MTVFPSFPGALHAAGPAPDLAAKLGLYGWLIGDWEMDAQRPLGDGERKPASGIDWQLVVEFFARRKAA